MRMIHTASNVFHMAHTDPLETAVMEAVRGAITASGMSKSEVSRRAGMARTTLHRRLRGRGDFTVSELARIAAVLRISPNDFFTRKDAA